MWLILTLQKSLLEFRLNIKRLFYKVILCGWDIHMDTE